MLAVIPHGVLPDARGPPGSESELAFAVPYALTERRGGGGFVRAAATRASYSSMPRQRMTSRETPAILANKQYAAESAFKPENLLREARRQKGLAERPVPEVCVLDPDGDIVRQIRASRGVSPDPTWACYHTDLYRVNEVGIELGIVGCAVGASFAVLVSEQLFASGCRLLISMTSAGQLVEVQPPPYFILIDRALRDEGTSYHYLPPAQYSTADPDLVAAMGGAFGGIAASVERGATWTTDAPFRETAEAISLMKREGLLAVEMEAAALYAFAQARGRSVICFAHVTNHMALVEGDFEKGEADGSEDALAVIGAAARAWMGVAK